ncbi:hypothetical protein ALC57_13500 [Trachymyrmex cornetzi]|uniref:Uncharacterized protein n=1 Tax=Trachymyrmex cornetzi TaxID=471704 RepID=A0A195DN82_9HYME|nr:hypothetical protein ALC57_13500 [Trachymyrmex cornetzi]
MKNILKRVSPRHGKTTRYDRANRIRSDTSRSHDLSVTRQRDGSVRSSPSTVINCVNCAEINIHIFVTHPTPNITSDSHIPFIGTESHFQR